MLVSNSPSLSFVLIPSNPLFVGSWTTSPASANLAPCLPHRLLLSTHWMRGAFSRGPGPAGDGEVGHRLQRPLGAQRWASSWAGQAHGRAGETRRGPQARVRGRWGEPLWEESGGQSRFRELQVTFHSWVATLLEKCVPPEPPTGQ